MVEIVDTKTTIIIIVAVIAFTIGIIVLVSWDNSNAKAVEDMNCTEIWDIIGENIEANYWWFVKECWK